MTSKIDSKNIENLNRRKFLNRTSVKRIWASANKNMRINVQKFDLNNTKLLTNLKPTVKLTKNEFKCKKKLAAFSRFYLNLRKKPKLSKATGTIKMKVKNKDILDATTAYQTQCKCRYDFYLFWPMVNTL